MSIRTRIKKDLIRLYSFGKPKKKVLFDSFGGTQYSADPRAISEKMHIMFPDYEIVWVINPNAREKNSALLPQYVRVVDGKMGFIKELATSAAYVTTEPLKESFYKRRGQYVVQTWHGDRAMKKVLYEAAESAGRTREKIYDDEYTDICVSSSNYGEDQYRKAFKFTGEVLKEGMPKNDKLVNFDEEEYSKLRKYFQIPDQVKVLTYAPTFRGHSVNEQNSEIDIERTLDTLESRGEKWVCLLRAHEYSKRINYEGNGNRVIDVSQYPDMADILVITDMLITDYSSCAGDYLVRRKPVILVINDEDEYKAHSRSLRVDLNQTGFILSHSQDELDIILMNTTEEEYRRACEESLAFYVTIETGHASDIVCKRINDNYISVTGRR